MDPKELADNLHTTANFAQTNDKEAIDRLRKRLSQDRRPTTMASTEASWVNWDSMSDYLGQPFNITKIPISKLEHMRRDPMISFGLTFAKIPLITAPWYIKSSDPQRAAFVEGCLRKIYGRFILAYCNCFDFGYSGIVKRFELADQIDWTYIDKSGEEPEEKPVWDENSLVKPLIWKPFLPLPPRNIKPHWNSRGEFAGIDYAPSGTPGPAYFPFEANKNSAADIPLDWALWATNEKDSVFGSLWGYPRTGYAYRYWWSYWYKFGLADRAFEKWADPPIIVRHPSDDGISGGEVVDYGSEALALAEKLRSGANVSLPSDPVTALDDRALNMRQWEIEQLSTEVNFDMLNQTFEYLDIQKLRAVMVPEQSLVEGKGGTSSRNVAQVFGELFEKSQAVVMQEIDDHINRYMIPQLLEVNFGPGGATCEKITTGFDPKDVESMRTIIGGIANKGTEELPIDIRASLKELGVPLLSYEDHQKLLEKKAAEAEQERVAEQDHQIAIAQAKAPPKAPPANLSEEEVSLFRRIVERLKN